MSKKKEHYSTLKLVIRILTLGISIWALTIAYQASNKADWNEKVMDNIIEKTLFK